MICHDAVDLLRHRSIERAESRFHVTHGDLKLRASERTREGGVRVAIDEDQVWRLLQEDLLETREHVSRLPTMAPGTDVELVVRIGDVKGVEEHVRHIRVVVLAGMDQDFHVVRADLATHGSGLDELRPRPDDARDLHITAEETFGL